MPPYAIPEKVSARTAQGWSTGAGVSLCSLGVCRAMATRPRRSELQQ